MEDLVFDAEDSLPTDGRKLVSRSPRRKQKHQEVPARFRGARQLRPRPRSHPKEGAADPDKQFARSYRSIERNEKHVDAISRASKKSKNLYWRTTPIAKARQFVAPAERERSKSAAIRGQVGQPRGVLTRSPRARCSAPWPSRATCPLDLVNAQQARRALDYLVRLNCRHCSGRRCAAACPRPRTEPRVAHDLRAPRRKSAFSCLRNTGRSRGRRAQRSELSVKAGRVQWPARGAVQLITRPRLATSRSRSMTPRRVSSRAVHRSQEAPRNRHPPFTTSTLQQEAARNLGYSAQRTMRLASSSMKGCRFRRRRHGLITYMRTDSLSLAVDAVRESAKSSPRIRCRGRAEEPRIYKTKSRNAQEAHEAIRPTSAAVLPSKLEARSTPTSHALLAHLETRRSLADGARIVRNRRCRHGPEQAIGRRKWCGSTRAARQRLDTRQAAGYMAVYQDDVATANPKNENDRILRR